MAALVAAVLVLLWTLAQSVFEWRRQETKVEIIRMSQSEDPDEQAIAVLMRRKHELYLEQLTARQRMVYWGWRAMLIAGNIAVVVYILGEITG